MRLSGTNRTRRATPPRRSPRGKTERDETGSFRHRRRAEETRHPGWSVAIGWGDLLLDEPARRTRGRKHFVRGENAGYTCANSVHITGRHVILNLQLRTEN